MWFSSKQTPQSPNTAKRDPPLFSPSCEKASWIQSNVFLHTSLCLTFVTLNLFLQSLGLGTCFKGEIPRKLILQETFFSIIACKENTWSPVLEGKGDLFLAPYKYYSSNKTKMQNTRYIWGLLPKWQLWMLAWWSRKREYVLGVADDAVVGFRGGAGKDKEKPRWAEQREATLERPHGFHRGVDFKQPGPWRIRSRARTKGGGKKAVPICRSLSPCWGLFASWVQKASLRLLTD